MSASIWAPGYTTTFQINDYTVPTLQALRDLVPLPFTNVLVLGHSNLGDGGGGFYYYDPSDATSVDNNGTIVVGKLSRRWKLLPTSVVTLATFGAFGNAGVDETTVIQNALNSMIGKILYVQSATFTTFPLVVPSYTTLVFSPTAKLYAAAGYGINDRLLRLEGVAKVTIYGNGAEIQMRKADYVSGEQRHGFFAIASNDVVVADLKVSDTGGDGFYVGRSGLAGTHCNRVRISGCRTVNVRRNGLSLVSVDTITVDSCTFDSTVGTSPQYGIDIEPNDSDDEMRAVNIVNCVTRNNAAGGILLALGNYVSTAPKTISVSITGCKSYNDVSGFVSGGASLKCVANGVAWVNTLSGTIDVTDYQSFDSQYCGMFIQDWDYLKGCKISVKRMKIVNPNATNAAAQPFDACGICAFNFSNIASVGNFVIEDVEVSGPNVYTAFYAYDTGGPVRDFTLKDVRALNATTSGFKNYVSNAGPNVNTSIYYTNEEKITLAVSTNVNNYPGMVCEITAGGAFTLPACSGVVGQKRILRNMADLTTEITPDAADSILLWSQVAGGTVVMNRAGDELILVATSAGWFVEYISWFAQRPKATGLSIPRHSYWGTAAPTTGTFETGDRVANSNASIGQPKAWYCTAGGTPGTWVSEGNL